MEYMENREGIENNREVEKKSSFSKIPKHNWALVTYALAIFSVILLITMFTGGTLTGNTTGNVIKSSDMKIEVENFVNTQLIPGGSIEVTNLESKNGIYIATIDLEGELVPLYFTKDGNFISPGRELIPITGNAIVNTNNPQTQTPTEIVEVSPDDDAVKGDANAPVTIIEFSDYECPFCGRHFKETLPLIIENYVNTGKVKLVFRDFPLSFHKNAQKAAEAAECAGEQGGNEAYWKIHDKLFENQQNLDIASLKQYAKDLGYNIDSCLDSGAMAEEVAKDMADGQAAGVSGTPAFFINGKLVSGAQPYSVFESEIEEALNSQ